MLCNAYASLLLPHYHAEPDTKKKKARAQLGRVDMGMKSC